MTGIPSTHGTDEDGDNVIQLLPRIAQALVTGHNLIEEATRDGGILVSDEIAQMAADMELVFAGSYGKKPVDFNTDLLIEIQRAQQNGDDPLDEVRLWLDEHLNEGQVLWA